MTQLNVTQDDLVRLLHSLSCAKYKILNKQPNTKTILPTDIFEFNSKFTDRMRRIKVSDLLELKLTLSLPCIVIVYFFYFNFKGKILNFCDCFHQIPLPPVDERKKVIEDVDKDRRYAIDAALVRIMKSRKSLAHPQLVMECVEQLGRMFKVLNVIYQLVILTIRTLLEFFFHFLYRPYVIIFYLELLCSACLYTCLIMQPDIKAIKKRMEDLITRDYLERDKDNPNVFRYLA